METAFSGKGPKLVVLRHGTQFSQMKDKINMMRLPHNMKEPLTGESMAQAVTTGVAFAFLAEKYGKSVRVIASPNLRAIQSGTAIAGVGEWTLERDRRLKCPNYKPVSEMSDQEINNILPGGTLSWEEEKVNKVCVKPKGQIKGVYEQITDDVLDIVKEALFSKQEENSVTIIITHTQQLDALATLLGYKTERLGEFGGFVISAESGELRPTKLPKGIFAA